MDFKKSLVLILCMVFLLSQVSACSTTPQEYDFIELPNEEILTLEENAPVKDLYTISTYKLPKESADDNVIFYAEQDKKAYYTRHEIAPRSNSAKKAEIGYLENETDKANTLVSSTGSKHSWYNELNLLEDKLVFVNHLKDKYQVESIPANGGNIKVIAKLKNPVSLSVIDGLIYVYELKGDKALIKSINPSTQEEKVVTDNVYLISPNERISWEDSNHSAWFEKIDGQIFLFYKDKSEMKKIRLDKYAVCFLSYHDNYLTWMELPEETSWHNEKIHVYNTKTEEHKLLKLPEAGNFVSVNGKIYLIITKSEDNKESCKLYEWDLASDQIRAIHSIEAAQNIVSFPKVYGNGNILINYEKDDQFCADFLSSK